MTSSIYILAAELDAANNLAAQLRNYGYKAKSFVNASVMMNVSANNAPTLFLVEEQCYGEEHDFNAIAPVLFLGESDSLASRLMASNKRARGFIAKPINLSVLINRIYQIEHKQNSKIARVAYIGDHFEHSNEWQLDEFGMILENANCGDELLEHLQQGGFDALMLDGDMTSHNPIDMARVLRQHDDLLALPMMVLTEGSKRPFDEPAAELGIDAVIGLPIRGQDLAAMTRSRVKRSTTLEREFFYLSKRDAISGLFNEHYLAESLNHLLLLEKELGNLGALVYLKIDSANKQTPVIMGNLLRKAVRPPDFAVRMDNGDFVILSYSNDEREFENTLTRLKQGLAKHEGMSYSYGISLLNAQLNGASHAINKAQNAVSTPVVSLSSENETVIEAAAPQNDWEERWGEKIRHAIARNRFRLVYQPIANLNGVPASFYEVYLRMIDEQGNDILPQEFLAGAQDASLASEIDYWVIDHSAHILKERASKVDDKPVLFIKLFPASLDNPDTAKRIRGVIDRNNISGEQFVFQIPQFAANTRTNEIKKLIDTLKPTGCKFLIEHFGRQPEHDDIIDKLATDYVKLDGALTQDIMLDPDKQSRVTEIAALAKDKNVSSVASLVQDASAMAVLWNCGVDYIQGYFMQEPADVFA